MKLSYAHPNLATEGRPSQAGFTLAEVCVATVIAAMTVAGIIQGYTQSTKRAEWSAYSLAAQALAAQRLEQTRACRWDTETGVDQLVAGNFPSQTVLLDIPVVGTNGFYATNDHGHFGRRTAIAHDPGGLHLALSNDGPGLHEHRGHLPFTRRLR